MTAPPSRRAQVSLMRDARHAPLPVAIVGILAALVGYWVIHHWQVGGGAAVGIWFVMVFLWIGVLASWFGRMRAS